MLFSVCGMCFSYSLLPTVWSPPSSLTFWCVKPSVPDIWYWLRELSRASNVDLVKGRYAALSPPSLVYFRLGAGLHYHRFSPFSLFLLSKNLSSYVICPWLHALLLSCILALSVAAAEPEPLTDTNSAIFLAAENGEWLNTGCLAKGFVSFFFFYTLCSCVSDTSHSLVLR